MSTHTHTTHKYRALYLWPLTQPVCEGTFSFSYFIVCFFFVRQYFTSFYIPSVNVNASYKHRGIGHVTQRSVTFSYKKILLRLVRLEFKTFLIKYKFYGFFGSSHFTFSFFSHICNKIYHIVDFKFKFYKKK